MKRRLPPAFPDAYARQRRGLRPERSGQGNEASHGWGLDPEIAISIIEANLNEILGQATCRSWTTQVREEAVVEPWLG